MNMIQLEQTNSHYLLSIPQALMARAKKIKPRQWDPLGLVWKYPRDKDTYELLLDEFENDIEKVVITPPNNINTEESQNLAKKNKTISDLQKKVNSLESNLSLIKDQRDQYLSSIIQLTKKVEHLKNEDNNLEKRCGIHRRTKGDHSNTTVCHKKSEIGLEKTIMGVRCFCPPPLFSTIRAEGANIFGECCF